jgi:molybdopterin/thiamine biosynthesis adenylyltransferase
VRAPDVPRRDPDTHVHIGGAGRVGTAVALTLHTAGIRHISCNDPQMFEEEQFGCMVFSRRSDLGCPKVHVLERFFDGRPGIIFEPLVAPNESPKVRPLLEKADVIVSAANKLSARLYLEHAAIALRKPVVQASVQDGRRALGGSVSVWTPSAGCACFGCLFPRPKARFSRGEVLPPAVTSAVAAIAAQRVLDLLGGKASLAPNLTIIDLAKYAMEMVSVAPRPGCKLCAGAVTLNRAGVMATSK